MKIEIASYGPFNICVETVILFLQDCEIYRKIKRTASFIIKVFTGSFDQQKKKLTPNFWMVVHIACIFLSQA